jgi:ubiquinone/menaquinone biosynthesis C-methylase UbiE
MTEHYGEGSFEAQATRVLHEEGLDHPGITWSDLARLDHFHTGGLEATKGLGNLLGPRSDQRVLDVGSGLGGPARYMAATFGCHVTGIDLTSDFVRVATTMSGYAGLADKNTFIVANALQMPFADASFDLAYSQHVAMNIADREGLYAEIRRVLKPGAQFGVHDVLIGNGELLEYPLPWASTAETSHLVPEAEMQSLITGAGFELVKSVDMTDIAKQFFRAQIENPPDPSGPRNMTAFLGPEFLTNLKNLARQTLAGRFRMVMALYRAT